MTLRALTRWTGTGLAIVALALAGATGCSDDDPLEEAGDRMEDAADDLGDRFEEAGEEIEDEVDDAT